MAERKQSGKTAEDEEVPAFFKNLGSGSPKPRQKFCGMFCPVEGSSENKTIDFDSLSVGRGSGQVVAQQRDVAHLGPDPHRQSRRASGEPSVESSRKVEIRRASGKEALQNIYDQVGMGRGKAVGGNGERGWLLACRGGPSISAWQPARGAKSSASRICTRTAPCPPLHRAGCGEARVRQWASELPQRLPSSPCAWEVGNPRQGPADPRAGGVEWRLGWTTVLFLNPPGRHPIAAAAQCPTLF